MVTLTPLLTTYAYNILGSLEDARDVVQDAFLKFELTDKEKIIDQKSYLVRTVINLSINLKKKQKKLVAEYPGQWLPEPVDTEYSDSAIEKQEILSYSLMVLMEKLNPKQRAVFILKEAFDYEHEEISDVLGISVDNSRQLLNRARKQLQHVMSPAGKNVQTEQLNKYLHVIRDGDTTRLEELLNEEIAVISDGGGKVPAFTKPVFGRKSVTALLLGVYKKNYTQADIVQTTVNHQPALFYYKEGVLVLCQVLIFRDGLLETTFFIRNPDKLKTLQNKL